MNRIRTGFCLFLVSLLFVSCATLPKAVKENDSLVIGEIEINAFGYSPTYGISMSGIITSGIELTIQDLETKHIKTVTGKKNGFIMMKNLKNDHRYRITGVKVTKNSNDGASYSIAVSDCNIREFVPEAGKVANIGKIYLDFDGNTNIAAWTVKDAEVVAEYFNNLDPESEWHLAEMVNYR